MRRKIMVQKQFGKVNENGSKIEVGWGRIEEWKKNLKLGDS